MLCVVFCISCVFCVVLCSVSHVVFGVSVSVNSVFRYRCGNFTNNENCKFLLEECFCVSPVGYFSINGFFLCIFRNFN